MEIPDRIKQFFDSRSITQQKFADEIGVKRPSIATALRGKSIPNSDLLSKIAIAFPEIDCRWLLTGEGAMLRNAAQENQEPKAGKPPFDSIVFNYATFNINISDRIKKIFDLERITQKAFAEKIGVNPSSFSNVIYSGGTPRSDMLAKISITFPEIDCRWLLTGEGSMLRNTAQENQTEAMRRELKHLEAQLAAQKEINRLQQEINRLQQELIDNK